MQSDAATVTQYLAELPEDRRKAIKAVRAVVRKHLPKGYEERMDWGVIAWTVPLEVYPDNYSGKPLCYAGLASQKNHMALYLMYAYMDKATQQKLVKGFKTAGKRLDMGKSCIRFKKLEDLPLDVIGEVVAAVPMKAFVETAKRAHAKRK